MLKYYVRHGMVVEKNLEIISFKQSKCLEKYIRFNTKKRNRAKIDLEKTSLNYLLMLLLVNFLENVRNRLRLELIKRKNIKNNIKHKIKNNIQWYLQIIGKMW